MKREYHYFQGKSMYSKILKPDLEYRNWNQPVILTPKSYEDFMKLKEPRDEGDGKRAGILTECKKTEDGYMVTFKRPMEKTYGGKSQAFAPPVVLNADGTPWESGKLIGNGSDVTVKVELYGYTQPVTKKKGSAIRMESVRVDNLVPYEMKKDFSDVELQQASGLSEQPAPQPF